MEVGYKVFRADVLRRIHLKSNRFGFEPEVASKVAKLGRRIREVPIRYYDRTYQEGKKIGWRDGLAAFFHILRDRFLFGGVFHPPSSSERYPETLADGKRYARRRNR